jgi:single-strand DNA-binding protein
MYMNKVILAGFLGKDATVHSGNNGNFTILELATKSSYKDKESEKYISRTEWHKLIVFGGRGEWAAKLKKGDHVLVEGELRHTEYESKKTNTTQQSDSIRVSNIQKLDRTQKTSSEAEEAEELPLEDEAAYPYAARPKNGSPVLDQGLKCPFGRGVSKNRWSIQSSLARHCASCGRGDNNDARTLTQNGQELLHQEERASDVGRKEVVKILHCVIHNMCRLADSGVEHQHIQPIADNGAHLFGEQRCAVRSAEVRRDSICAPTLRFNRGDKRFRSQRRAAIVNQNVRPGLRERRCRRAANSSRCACHKRHFVLK